MATRTEARPAVPAADHAEVEQLLTDLCRVFARMAVKSSMCGGAATFAKIIIDELHIATHEEAARIEKWLTSHP